MQTVGGQQTRSTDTRRLKDGRINQCRGHQLMQDVSMSQLKDGYHIITEFF